MPTVSVKVVLGSVPVAASAWPLGAQYRPPARATKRPCSGCKEPLWVTLKIDRRVIEGTPIYCPNCLDRMGHFTRPTYPIVGG